MMVVDNRKDPIHNSMITLNEPNSNPKEDVDNRICQLVDLGLEECPHRCLSRNRRLPALALWEVGGIGEVWLQKGLAFCCAEASAIADVFSEDFLVSVGDHCSCVLG